MAYTPTVWKNGEFPPIDAEHLNKIEQGIANSAPGGFGLGTRSKWLTNADDLNNIYQGGFYFWYGDNIPANAPDGINYGGMIVMSRSATEFVQQVFNITDIPSLQNCMLVRTAYNNTWYPWEWVNPPMQLGIEYRTTEKYLGKPVYVKVVDCGHFAAAGTVKEIMVPDGNVEHMVGCTGRVGEWQIPATLFAGNPADAGDVRLEGRVDDSHHFYIYLYSKAYDLTTWQTIVTIKYTKTTD